MDVSRSLIFKLGGGVTFLWSMHHALLKIIMSVSGVGSAHSCACALFQTVRVPSLPPLDSFACPRFLFPPPAPGVIDRSAGLEISPELRSPVE